MKIDIQELAKFIVEAKSKTWAGNGKEIIPQRPGFKELGFAKKEWEYRDSYCGFFMAPGQEYVKFKGEPVWMMAYSGGMIEKYIGNKEFAKDTFEFLKKALQKIEITKPFRGPEKFKEGFGEYINLSQGDIKNFRGIENIYYKGEEVFKQNYCGGLIIPKFSLF